LSRRNSSNREIERLNRRPKEGLKGKVQGKRKDRKESGLEWFQVPMAALGTAQKVHVKLLQIDFSPGQGGVVKGIIKLNQHEVKLAAAKGAEEVRSDAIDSLLLSFFPQKNRFPVFLPARHPGWGGVGRLAGRKRPGQFIQIIETGHGKVVLLLSNMT
jgi:hypothetical protein